MAESTYTPTEGRVAHAYKYLCDELETMLALSIVLVNQLEPVDPESGEGVTAWRLAQVLNERLEGVDFLANMRMLLLGSREESDP